MKKLIHYKNAVYEGEICKLNNNFDKNETRNGIGILILDDA